MGIGAVVIDSWKLPIFEKHLTDAGFSYEIAGALSPGLTTLRVSYEQVGKLHVAVMAAQRECRQ